METSTKEKIMDAAIVLFSEKGYDNVSMRDIAGEVGIKASSIYNHFPSKQDILKSIYDFYVQEHRLAAPNRETLLQCLETEPFHDVLAKISYYWPPPLRDRMDRIILVASQRIYLDKDSEKFIQEHFFEPLTSMWDSLLNRAVELDKIEPVNIEAFSCLATYYAFSAAELNRTTMKISFEQWSEGLSMILSLIKPITGKIEK